LHSHTFVNNETVTHHKNKEQSVPFLKPSAHSLSYIPQQTQIMEPSGKTLKKCPVFHEMGTVCPISHKQTQGGGFGACTVSTSGGLDLRISIEGGKKNPIPMSNIPPVVSFAELKTFLKIANIELPAGKNWDDVEFFFEREFWFPIPEHLTLQATDIKSGQVIHVNFKYDCNKGEPVSVFILGKARPITFKFAAIRNCLWLEKCAL